MVTYLKCIFLTTATCLFISLTAHSDITVKQECHSYTKAKAVMSAWKENTLDYTRILFIKGNLFSIQLHINKTAAKEFGFDFDENMYYEADLLDKKLIQISFNDINREFTRIQTKDMNSKEGPSAILEDMMKGNAGLDVKSSRSLFWRKDFSGITARLYKHSMGPGYSPFRPMSWGKDIKAWVTKEIQNYAEFEKIQKLLKEKCRFYRTKNNEISDLMTAIIHSDGFPIALHTVVKRDFGMAVSVRTSDEVSTHFITEPIDNELISYYRDKETFTITTDKKEAPASQEINTEKTGAPASNYPVSTVSQGIFEYKERPSILRRIYKTGVPVVFFSGLVYIFFLNLARKTSKVETNAVLIKIYWLFTILFLLTILHIFIPYYRSMEYEFSALLTAGCVVIVLTEVINSIKIRKALKERPHLQLCPHCKALVEKTYSMCPKCNGPIV